MLRNDYILRMAEQIGTAMAALIVKADHGKGPEALDECRELCRQHVGLDLDFIVRLAPPNLLQLLQQGGQSWSGRAAGLVEILLGHARLAEACLDRQTALPCYVHAYYLLRELTPLVSGSEALTHQAKLDSAAATLTALGLGQLTQSQPLRVTT
jgi:hypothetical protein